MKCRKVSITYSNSISGASTISCFSYFLFIFFVAEILVGKEAPNKPTINDTGSSHINNVTRMKHQKQKPIEMISAAQIHHGFPEEHVDEVGPSTH